MRPSMKTDNLKTRCLSALLVALLAPLACGARDVETAPQRSVGERARVVRGSLGEVQGRRRVALLASKALVVDAREPALAALEDYRRAMAGRPPRQHGAAARLIAAKLNKYIRKHRMMTAATEMEEADLVLVFKVTAQRPSAITGEPFVWGKLYVIALGPDRSPRLVWESEGDDKE